MIQKKYIFIVLAAFAVICLLYFLFFTYPRLGKIAVDIRVNPEDAAIIIDGDKSHAGTVYLRPGTHTFKAAKSGWFADEVTVSVSKNNATVALLPQPDSDEAQQQAEDDAMKREGLSSTAANTRGVDIRSANPILNKLPYSDISGPYKIDYGFNQQDEKTPYLIVSYSTPHGREKALKWLKSNKLDVTTTEVVFQDFISPIHAEESGDE